MDFLNDYDFLDGYTDDFEDDYKPRKTKVKLDTDALKKNRRADEKAMKTCAECNKKFSARLSCGLPWQYHDYYKGKKQWYCSYTCISRNRKARKNDK